MDNGHIEVDSVEQIAIQDITHELAVVSGFKGVIDRLKVAGDKPLPHSLLRSAVRRFVEFYAFTREFCGIT